MKYNENTMAQQSEREAVRTYPNVYLGSNDLSGATQTIYEILSNSVDEAGSGFGDEIRLTIHEDNSVTVEDKGRGIPMDFNSKQDKYNWEIAYCTLHAGGKIKGSRESYNSSAGQHGIGASATNFSSKYMEVESKRGGYVYAMRFEEGLPKGKLKKVKNSNAGETGTKQTWLPDDTVFTDINFNRDDIEKWVKSQAVVNSGVRFIFKDERDGHSSKFLYEEGIKSYAGEVLGDDKISSILTIEESGSGRDESRLPIYTVKADVVFGFSKDTGYSAFFHNSIPLELGGSPKYAMEDAFVEFFEKELRKNKLLKKQGLKFEDIAENLVFISSTYTHIPPSYSNQTKKSIQNKFIQAFLTGQIVKRLEKWVNEEPLEAEAIIKQIAINQEARIHAHVQRLATKKKLVSNITIKNKIPNYVDCRSKDTDEKELYICEGLSALSALKQGRNSEFQALLPIRGKLLNCKKATFAKVVQNDLISNIIRLVGTGIEISSKNNTFGSFDMDNLRFDKIVFACDRDEDGGAIEALLLTLFYEYMPKLIEEGHIYILRTPLYEIEYSNGEMDFIYSEAELSAFKTDRKYKVARNKGLGELSVESMARCLNPDTRQLLQVTIGDAKEADRMFEIFMGKDAEPRKEYIQKNSDRYMDIIE